MSRLFLSSLVFKAENLYYKVFGNQPLEKLENVGIKTADIILVHGMPINAKFVLHVTESIELWSVEND